MNKALLGDVEFSAVENESPSNTAEVTENPVEKGEDIADHVKLKPYTMAMSGIVVGDDATQKLQKLSEYFRKGQVLTYVGRNVVNNVVIEQFDRVHDSSISNGFAFSFKLKQIRIVAVQEITIKNPAVKTQMKKTSAAGLKQTVNRGVSQEKIDMIFRELERKGLTPNFTGGGGDGGGGGGAGAF